MVGRHLPMRQTSQGFRAQVVDVIFFSWFWGAVYTRIPDRIAMKPVLKTGPVHNGARIHHSPFCLSLPDGKGTWWVERSEVPGSSGIHALSYISRVGCYHCPLWSIYDNSLTTLFPGLRAVAHIVSLQAWAMQYAGPGGVITWESEVRREVPKL